MRAVASVIAFSLACSSCLGMDLVQTFVGEAPNDQFGISVGSCDLNGDGWTDIVVGANTNDAGGSAAGRTYVFLGGGGDSVPDLILTGPVSGGHFGWSVSGVGDVNQDGFEDVVVGAHFTSDLNTRAGKAYVFFGSDTLDATPDMVLMETLYDARLGYAVSGGDLNGDGYSEVVVGAPNANNKGMVKLFLGGDPPDTVCDFLLHGEGTYDFFGSAVSLSGDINGDGYADLVVGAYGYNRGSVFNVGRAYVYFGGTSPDTIPDLILEGENQNDYFGCSVSTSGDINLDGVNDLCVGSYGSDVGDSTAVGKCYIFLGGDSLGVAPDTVLWSGATHNENFGTSVSLGPPGAASPQLVLVGADGNDDAGTDAGKIYAFIGPSPSAGAPDDEAAGAEAGSSFGHSVHLVRNFTSSQSGALALSGAYEEGLSGKAKLLSIGTSGIPSGERPMSQVALIGNPFTIGEAIEFGNLGELRDTRLLIVDVTGRVVSSLDARSSGNLVWEGKALHGGSVAPGTYFFLLYPSSRRGKIVLIR